MIRWIRLGLFVCSAALFVWLLAIGSTVASIVGPKILGKATTKLFEGVMAKIGGTGTIDFTYIGHIIVTVLLLYLLSAVLAYIQGWVMTNVSMNISYRFRKDISEKINRMPFKYFDGTSHGEVLSRITNDVDTVSQTLNQSLTQIITSVTTVIGVVVMMFSISWQMTLVALIMLPISFGIISLIIGKSQVFFKRQQDYLGHINGHVEEMYGSHAVVKAFNGEAKSIRKFDSFNGVLYETSWKSQFLSGLMFPIMGFVGNLGYVAICVVGGYLAVRGTITIGDIQAFIQYVRTFIQPITQIANISNILQQTMAAAERVFEFLNEEEECAETTESIPTGYAHPELFSLLPKNVIAVPWYYEMDLDFNRMVEPFARNKIPQVIGTGIQGWNPITPDFEVTFGNVNGFLEAGRKHGIIGMVAT